ncbi:MAG: hypothetical protein ACJ766_06265 [Thermoleophilaceae bacterium]
MTADAERFFVDAYGMDEDAVKRGLAWLLGFAREHSHDRAAIFVSANRQVEQLAKTLGVDPKKLVPEKSLVLGGIEVEIFTEKKIPPDFEGPILGLWVDDKQMQKLDDTDAPGLCAVPWNKEYFNDWKETWNPVDIRTGEASGDDASGVSPLVQAALQSLTDRVNLSTGLSHPSDKDSAVGLFKILRNASEDYDPARVRGWAARHGWQAEDAREGGEVAEKIQAGRTVQVREHQMWADDILDQWRAEAASK